jgi:hydroxymethylbilane synthase
MQASTSAAMTSELAILRLGTRASPLAMAQARLVRDALCSAHGWNDDAVEIVSMIASGDRILDRALADAGGKALWTKELDRALLDGEIDFAVHSMKDVETIRPTALQLTAILPRADVRDRLIGAESIEILPRGARVGTSSPRRTAQMLHLRPDLEIVLFRGNVATRLAKLAAGEADATLLAAAGLDRLGMAGTGVGIAIKTMLPAPAQGAVGIETRSGDDRTAPLIRVIDDPETHKSILAERAFLAALSADCRSPVAALAARDGEKFLLRGQIFAPDGSELVDDIIELVDENPNAPADLAGSLLKRASPALRRLFNR